MTTDYDPIAEQYKRSKLQPWRAHVEAFTLMKLVGNLAGKAVVDVACGEGFYTRILRQWGAAKVTGVDLSPKMIELAQNSEAQQQLGIEYSVGDGRDMNFGPVYDLAVAAYFLNYAHDRAELKAMCNGIARCLKRGGRFVTVNSNPACDFSSAPSYRKYGFETSVVGAFREEAPITWRFYLDDGPFQIENYFLSVQTHEDALRAAGFRDIRWHRPLLSPQGEAARGRDYWAAILDHPPITFLEASLQVYARNIRPREQTPVLSSEEARKLLDSIESNTLIGLRDRALIGTMVYSFARVGAAVTMKGSIKICGVEANHTNVELERAAA